MFFTDGDPLDNIADASNEPDADCFVLLHAGSEDNPGIRAGYGQIYLDRSCDDNFNYPWGVLCNAP